MSDRNDLPTTLGTRQRDIGQATVELALATPLLMLMLLGIVQLTLVVRDQLRVIDLARLAARAAAVAADPSTAAGSVVGRDPPRDLRIVAVTQAGTVTVTVSATSITNVPLIGLLMPDVGLRAQSTMTLEPP